MRQAWHKLLGLMFWVLTVVLWVSLVRAGKAGMHNVSYSVQYVAIVGGAVLAVTVWWIRHNVGIYRRKGPRRARAVNEPDRSTDRLGRDVRWQLQGGHIAAVDAGHLVVELDGDLKIYSRGG